MVEVTDNLLPDDQFIEIQRHMLGALWPWYFNTLIDSSADEPDPSKSQFTYSFFSRKAGWVNSGEKSFGRLLGESTQSRG